MVPIIAGGAAILAFVTWGKDVFGESTFKKILHAGIALGVLGVIYITYKAYRAWMDAKEAGEAAVEKVTKRVIDSYDWIFEGAGEEADRVLDNDRYNALPGAAQDFIKLGETVGQLVGGSPATAGRDTAQATYNSLYKKYGPKTAERYRELGSIGRLTITAADYFGAGDAVVKTKQKLNKLKFW